MSASDAENVTEKRALLVATLLAAASAAAAAAHELVWARMLGKAVGNTSIGTGLALGMFMLGSGAGALFVPRTSLWSRPRRAYVLAEITIGLGAAALFAYCAFVSPPSAIASLDGWLGQGADILAAGLVALVPAVAMGATFPLLVRAVGAPNGVSRVYAAGLAGAVAGIAVAALGLAPVTGLDGVAIVATAINVAVAVAAALALPARHVSEPPAREPRAARGADDRNVLGRFAAAGIVGLGAQGLWNRCLAPYAGVSTFTFASIVAIYVLAQAAAFAIARRLESTRLARIGTIALALAPSLVLVSFATLSWLAPEGGRDEQPFAWLAAIVGSIALGVAPTASALGFAQAAALRAVERRADGFDDRAASITGLGTIASALGAAFVSLVGIPLLGPRWSVVALALAPLAVLAASEARAHAYVAIAGAAALAALAPGPAYFLGKAYDAAPVLHAEHGVQDTTGVVTVDLPAEPRIRRLVSNGVSYSGDSIFAQRYMRLLAHLPALAARGDERALLICVGTGTTLDALRAHPFDRIDAVDLSPSIHETLRFFSHVNHDAHRDRRVALVIDDGARYLRRTSERYDVITLEPPPPRAPGGSSLYTRELYEAAARRLRPGGALAQWLPLHGLSGDEARALVRTFVEVFPTATLHLAERNEAILVGLRERGASAQERARRASAESIARDLANIGAAGTDPWADTLVLEGAALRELVTGGAIVRDAWPMPEYAPLGGAGRETLDAFLDRVAERAHPAAGSSASLLGPIAGAFVRIQEGRASSSDGAAVTRAMTEWLRARPDDPYVQHAFGFGPLLERRLERVAGELSADELRRVRALHARRRAAIERRATE